VREALSNVARHAQASTAQVQLKVVGGVLQLTVSDDGVGIGSTTRSSGLANLRERAQLLSGTFEVSSGGTGGTRLVWTVPIID
jgi:signal transduction histidine kinase